jgi:uncharacterized repeat protein (TIGR03837 family)
MLWDIFCKVIDNHGDLGLCWRLSAGLARRGQQVRLWIDQPQALGWMAPNGQAGVEVLAWTAGTPAPAPGDVLVEALGCDCGPAMAAAVAAKTRAQGRQPAWIDLEYLTAESFAGRSHGLPSPVQSGPAAGLVKYFFYPGFTAATGGLLREADLLQRQAAFDRARWLHSIGIACDNARLVSLFCYEPAQLPALLAQLEAGPQATRLLVTAGRATTAVQAIVGKQNGLQPAPAERGLLSISYLPLLSQHEFDHLLWACDFNFVRGEDSLVRALWAGQPFAWQLYPQGDGAHHAKLQAFLNWLEAPPAVRQLHAVWNGAADGPLPVMDTARNHNCALATQRLQAQPDLVTQLLHFVAQRR